MTNDLAKVEGDVVYLTQRPACPFYGFAAVKATLIHGTRATMIDSNGNQCALKIKSFSPCAMEMNGDLPNWNGCPYNAPTAQALIRDYAADIRVFPSELCQSETGFQGVPLDQWMARF